MPLTEIELEQLKSLDEVVCPCLDNPDGECERTYCKCLHCRKVKQQREDAAAEAAALLAQEEAQLAEETNSPTT